MRSNIMIGVDPKELVRATIQRSMMVYNTQLMHWVSKQE